MSSCPIDHTLEDTKKKLESQKEFLPEELYKAAGHFLNSRPSQDELNELFHLLKKYDLAADEEKQMRNKNLKELTKQ
ncbi:group-specific protein [Halobacillus sp. A5]|uniref:group-specific protein n=1 Tax=Halobacillus sp. A5 TaxID=2880263 RepID=UPI0020A69424|nr:group-specific protein [Halobacillus sp. A5]MCP3026396.1 group-specific protein [Halobacillus sp. A5]